MTRLSTVGALIAATAVVIALAGSDVLRAARQDRPASPDPIRVGVNLVTTPVTVRDRRGVFLSDLKPDDFEIYEDGVKQGVVLFSLSHGGRLFNLTQPAGDAAAPGILLPASRPASDSSGRLFLIFIDDAHLEPGQTPRVRELFNLIAKRLIHEGDIFGILSTGPSSIEMDFTYDRRRLAQASAKIMGAGLTAADILSTPSGAQGPPEVRHRVQVAFATAYDIINKLSALHDRRKVMIYLSNGYDLDPFTDAREKKDRDRSGEGDANPFRPQAAFSEADLVSQMSELTRAANRANVSIFTLDPRGLTAGADISQPIDAVSYQRHLSKTQNTLRVLAEQTGGTAVVNQNDFEKALDRIDAETSDYYMLGYYSNNQDPLRRRRRIEIKVKRPDTDVRYRTEYSLKPPDR